MVIERLLIRNFHRIRSLEISFESSVAVLPPAYAKPILKAIGILTKSEAFSGPESGWRLRKNTLLQADLRLADRRYTVSCRQDPENLKPRFRATGPEGEEVDPQRFFYRIHISQAEAEARVYDGRKSFAELFRAYEDPERYYPPGAFFRQTEGIGTTRLFRKKLKEFEERGVSESGGDPCNYELFLQINSMWDEIEEVRDLHHERWPVFAVPAS